MVLFWLCEAEERRGIGAKKDDCKIVWASSIDFFYGKRTFCIFS
jgi:hypothetical protein